MTYKDAGVNIEEGDLFIEKIKPIVASTKRNGCANNDIGSFGAIFDLLSCGYTDPVLVSATKGVGSKIKVTLILLLFYFFDIFSIIVIIYIKIVFTK